MSVARPIEADDHRALCTPDRGVVAVHHYGLARCRAECSCGWAGRRRYLMAAARVDAWQHAIEQRCDVSVPLTVRAALSV